MASKEIMTFLSEEEHEYIVGLVQRDIFYERTNEPIPLKDKCRIWIKLEEDGRLCRRCRDKAIQRMRKKQKERARGSEVIEELEASVCWSIK